MGNLSFIERLADRFAVTFNGGVRIRFYECDGNTEVKAYGQTPRVPTERLIQLIQEVSNNKTGTVDLRRHGNANWTIVVHGELLEDGIDQRIRNVIINS